MPRDFLVKMSTATLPFQSEDPYELRCIHVLRAAEMIDAEITAATGEGERETAVVHRITPLGRAEIEKGQRRW